MRPLRSLLLCPLIEIAALILASAVLPGCSQKPKVAAAAATPAPDLSRKRSSARGTLRATITPEIEPIPVNQIHSWKLRLERPDGQPVEKARIVVTGLMPEHNHGMATQPRVTGYAGDGTFVVSGIKLQMRGWWTIHFSVEQGVAVDVVSFDVMVP